MPKRIAIIGAGPIGLEAALYARTLGHEVIVFERGEVGANVDQWSFVRLFSPWLLCTTSLGRQAIAETAPAVPLEQYPTGYDFRERYLLPLAACSLLRNSVREQNPVVHVSRDDNADRLYQITARDPAGRQYVEHADLLLDCAGTYMSHRWAGRNDRPAPGEADLRDRIFYTIPDVLGRHRDRFADRHTLIIGCTYCSGIVLRDLQDLAANRRRTTVTWAVRRPDQAMHPVLNDPLRARGRLVEFLLRLLEHPPAWLHFLSTAVLDSITATDTRFTATFHSNRHIVSLTPHEIVSLNGFRPDYSIYEPPAPTPPAGEQEPGPSSPAIAPDNTFFILGAKSYGTNMNFLLQAGHMQISESFTVIEGKPELDLYQ